MPEGGLARVGTTWPGQSHRLTVVSLDSCASTPDLVHYCDTRWREYHVAALSFTRRKESKRDVEHRYALILSKSSQELADGFYLDADGEVSKREVRENSFYCRHIPASSALAPWKREHECVIRCITL